MDISIHVYIIIADTLGPWMLPFLKRSNQLKWTSPILETLLPLSEVSHCVCNVTQALVYMHN